MATVSVSSSDLPAVIADALGEPPPKAPQAAAEAPKIEAKPEAPGDDDGEIDFAEEIGITKEQHERINRILQKEIGKKHRRAREAEEFAAVQYSERQLADARARNFEEENARLKSQLQPKAPEIDPDAGKPKREDFQTDDAFRDAVDDWRVDQRFKAREKEAADAHQAQIVESAKANIARAIEVIPDYVEVTQSADFIVPSLIAVWMQESPRFAELGYHFAKQPEELGKLAIMDQTKAKVAFKEIEAKLSPFAASAKADPKPDNGVKPSDTNGIQPSPKTDLSPSRPRPSAPITPLSSASSVQIEKAEPEMNVREVITKWSRDNKVNLERRKRH